MTVANWALAIIAPLLVALFIYEAKRATGNRQRDRQLTNDLLGSPARPGVPAVPGVMERLSTQDDSFEELKAMMLALGERLKRVEWHTGNGNPKPMREVVDETSALVAGHTASIEDILGVIGTRRTDTKRAPITAKKPRAKSTVKP